MIKFHPSDEMIHQFAAGSLGSALSVVISTHIDMCPHCQKQVQDAEQLMAEQLTKSATSKVDSRVLDSMLEQIFNTHAPMPQASNDSFNSTLNLDGKVFHLPPTLARQHARIGPWSRVPGKLLRAPIDIGSDECINLIYMDQGSRVPEHTHKGQEITLVVNGVFNDERDEYQDGDFVVMDEHHHHTPQTQDEDCLTLATLEGPLHFTSGISRLLNPFSSLFFR